MPDGELSDMGFGREPRTPLGRRWRGRELKWGGVGALGRLVNFLAQRP